MRYLCLGFHDEAKWQALSEGERQSLLDESFAYEDVLRQQGHYLEGLALQSAPTAVSLRFGGGRVSVTDGPFAETKEQLGGVMVLEANDLNHAIQLMSRLPCMRVGGTLEIRAINEALSGSADMVRQIQPTAID